jgi:hypothetical protein
MAETHPYWNKLTSEDIQMIMKLPPVDVMTFDLGRDIKVTVSFYWRPIGRAANELREFAKDHPEFADIVESILTFDPQTVKTLDIDFHQSAGGKVDATVTTYPLHEKQPHGEEYTAEEKKKLLLTATFTFEQACVFIHATDRMARFLTSDGEVALN